MTDIDAKILAAVLAAIAAFLAAGIAAVASILGVVINQFGNRKTQVTVESLKGDLAERKSESDARRDYEYEARKRLYQECEPLLFQFYEASENALHRVYSLARSARGGVLSGERSWLSTPGYYMASTIYNLLVPAAVFKVIQRRLTLVDLAVEPHISSTYLLAKAIYLSFTDAFDLAAREPRILYSPDADGWERRRMLNPAQYWRQHVNLGRLDIAVEALVKKDSSAVERIRSFGEFEVEYHREQSEIGQAFSVFTDLFLDFHPKTRPILWRVLIAQSQIYSALPQIANSVPSTRRPILVRPIPATEREDFDWRASPDDATKDEVLAEPFAASEGYLKRRLKNQFLDARE